MLRVTEKTISLEVAKLLGLPFVVRGFKPCKFVHGDEGLELHVYSEVAAKWVKLLAPIDMSVSRLFSTNRPKAKIVEIDDDET